MRQLEADDVLVSMLLALKTILFGVKTKTYVLYLQTLNEGEIVEITEEEADRNFYIQALAGDIVDGYSGCPKE